MTHITTAAELIGLAYLALCLLVCGLFVGSVAITDLAWRWKHRADGKVIHIQGPGKAQFLEGRARYWGKP